ncbi:MAG TPA: hypothetical protein VMK13_12445 [Streptosporangiaceae bacterium]|nr:hypothetical protein [Streptosporangiaceae bacterium]
MRRMLVHGEHQETTTASSSAPLLPTTAVARCRQPPATAMLTAALAGDDVAKYFDIGSSFSLRLGGDVGRGIVTRHLFP